MTTFGRSARWPESQNHACGRAALKNPAASQKSQPGGKFQATSRVQPQRPALRQRNESRSEKPVTTTNKDVTARTLSLDVKQESISGLKENSRDEDPGTEPEAYSTSLLPTGVPDIDRDDAGEPQLCNEYAKDIYRYMFSLETKWPIRAGFLSSQVNVTAGIRARVVDWLIEVHAFFDFVPETLFLTVSLMDRYMQKHVVDKSKMQLLGISAFFVASKFEETMPPLLGDLVHVTDFNCNGKEVLAMEKQILRTVDWSLGRPLPLHFLNRNCKAAEASGLERNTALYCLELSLTDYFMASVEPSKQAAAALYCALQLHGTSEDCWDEKMVYYSGRSEKSFQPYVQRMAKSMLDAPCTKNKAAYGKFMSRRYDKVADLSATHAEKLRKISGQTH